MASTYLNQTLALTYEEDGKWALALDKDRVLFGKGFGKLLAYIQNNLVCKGHCVIWNYHLSEMCVWAGEERFTEIQRNTMNKFKVMYANIGENITFKNTFAFYNEMSLEEIAKQKHINSANELTITWNAAESERFHPTNKKNLVSRVPTTMTTYTKKEIGAFEPEKDFYRLGLSITEETYELIKDCSAGGLSGIDRDKKDMLTQVNCYDFKSFYPWIMVSQVFPYYYYRLRKNVSKQDFMRWIKDSPLWIARIEFRYVTPKAGQKDWLKMTCIYGEHTITNLDFEILKGSYNFKIAEVKEMIRFANPQPIPDKLKNYIFEKFRIKETYPKDTEEYIQAKETLNSIYGLFNQDRKKYNKPINDYSAKQRPMVIGRFVAAYGRYFLWSIMKNSKPVHWDTDGFKTEYDLSKEIFLFNQMRKIKDSMLGQLMLEEKKAEVTVFGNKQYLLNGKLKLSGTDGDLAKEYCNKIGEIPHCGLTIPPGYTSQVRRSGRKIVRLQYTIGKDDLSDRLQRNNI